MIDLVAWLLRLVVSLALFVGYGFVLGAGIWLGWHYMDERQG